MSAASKGRSENAGETEGHELLPHPKSTVRRFGVERQLHSGKISMLPLSPTKTMKMTPNSPIKSPLTTATKSHRGGSREDSECNSAEVCHRRLNLPSSVSTSASSSPRDYPSTPPSPIIDTFTLPSRTTLSEFHAQRKARIAGYGRKRGSPKADKIAPEGVIPSPTPMQAKKRCSWITSQSDAAYVSYHDEEWGVPVHDDKKLFELLVLGGVQAESTWSTILSKREIYRAAFADFDPAMVAKYDETDLASLKTHSEIMQSGGRIQGIVDNAKRVLEIVEEFGSFDHYLWSFVNYKPIVNNYRHTKHIPGKTPKSDAISKDLVRRGLRFVGPTVVYSLMQAAGMTNDHLVQCFRYEECKTLQQQHQQHQHSSNCKEMMARNPRSVQGELEGRKSHKPVATPICC